MAGHEIQQLSERALLVSVWTEDSSRQEALESLEELKNLTWTANAEFSGLVTQEIKKIDPATFIGKGKVEEVLSHVQAGTIDVVIFDAELNPRQNRNLEKLLGVKVIDRTGLILDIFAQRARTKEGKLQVELAQCLYLLPRLVLGHEGFFSRQGGGIGTRGPGETQLEVDRRRVKEKISRLKKELEKVRRSRDIHRSKRSAVPIPTVALVGYTNAGKSTLFRAITQADVLVEDKLFATLDPTVRAIRLPSGRRVLLSDTVGFIRNLPHALIESFKATFEEIREADLLVHVIDVSHPSRDEQRQTVVAVLKELEMEEKPVFEVFNKIDLIRGILPDETPRFTISARGGVGIDEFLEKLDRLLAQDFKTVMLRVPFSEGALIDFLHRNARILSKTHHPEGTDLTVEVYEKYLGQLSKYEMKLPA